MFDPPAVTPSIPTARRPAPSAARPPRPALPPVLAARVRPVSSTRDRLVPVLEPLAPLFPDRALRRGTTVLVTGEPGRGTATLGWSLLASATAGGWCAAVGLADPGVVALTELGVDLTRLALVPSPGARWADTAAALVDGLDVVLVRPPARSRTTAARHLVARTRDRQAVLVVLARRPGDWPEGPDVHLRLGDSCWWGVERGPLPLKARRAEVSSTGRRSAIRPVRASYWLPGGNGQVAVAGAMTA